MPDKDRNMVLAPILVVERECGLAGAKFKEGGLL